MKKNLIPYYLSRAVISLVFGGLLLLTGTSLWTAVILATGLLALFLLAPLAGRYSVHPEYGVTALRRDERTQWVNDKAGRNGFVAVTLALGGAAAYFGIAGASILPITVLDIILLIGVLTYFISDFILRRA